MSTMKAYSTVMLPWNDVAQYATAIVSSVLRRTVECLCQSDSYDYWAIYTKKENITNVEIAQLVSFVEGEPEMLKRALPTESNTTRSLEMALSRALLKNILKLDWEREFFSDEGLWLIGHFPEDVKLPVAGPDLLYVDSTVVDCSKLMPMKEFINRLFDEGGTLTDFTKLCEKNNSLFGTPLYWVYPITDGQWNGCYFVAVREGILAISYDMISDEDHEVFERESVRLCSAQELGWFLADWKHFSDAMIANLGALYSYQERKEKLQ